ncbi:hypothetical protein [Pampinifervens florentissimum]|uniref:hypothetical protein n=1 Tax=Pampinifervens florentissimum TaxID=1632019 RepID=UPI0013B48569|nr:hypothetical protein [Hydrogenobacter sp. T-8]QID32593.1 hypothetical protein G3M65_01865 [Hydrogenobacter sp. T-8]
MENLKEKLKELERLSLDPFKPEALREELENIMKSIPKMSKEEREELLRFLQKLEKRVEENYRICFGWIEEVFKGGFRRQV